MKKVVYGAALWAAVVFPSGVALAVGGPCTDDISQLAPKLGSTTTPQEPATTDSGQASKANTGSAAVDKSADARAAFQRAVNLNAKGDTGCKTAIDETRKLMPTQ